MSQTQFKVISQSGHALLKVSGSKFIGKAVSVENDIEIENYIKSERKEYFDATHWCYAYRIGWDNFIEKSNDDGEPKGTAGKPILLQIQHHGISNVLVLVTRYYGGTNLGTGGLTRAYGECAGLALSNAELKVKKLFAKLCFAALPDDIGLVYGLANKMNLKPESVSSAEFVKFEILILPDKTRDFCETIKEMTNGRIADFEIGDCIC